MMNTTPSETTKQCPICVHKMYDSKRYPNSVCNECIESAVTEDGQSIQFYNVDISGGFKSLINDKEGSIHECFINDKKCYADEARLGGIVVSIVNS